MVPRDTQVLIPTSVNATLYGKRYFANVIRDNEIVRLSESALSLEEGGRESIDTEEKAL